MFEGNRELEKMISYMKTHWPSRVKDEWQVALEKYPEILNKVIQDFTKDKTTGKKLLRIAGVSGSGKTTQLLPAAEKYFEKLGKKPILIAARRFVEYHPYYEEILDFYGTENVRKLTDEFATIMMFLTITALIEKGYDIILDVTLLDPEMEAILIKMLRAKEYEAMLLMVAVNPEVTEKFLNGRAWRHTKETEQEFIRATEKSLEFYALKMPEMRIVIWNTYEENPVYDGDIKDALTTFEKYSLETEIPEHDEEVLREAKINYFL